MKEDITLKASSAKSIAQSLHSTGERGVGLGIEISAKDTEFFRKKGSRKTQIISILAVTVFSVLLVIMSLLSFQKANIWASVAGSHPSELFWGGLEHVDRDGVYSGSYIISTYLFCGGLFFAFGAFCSLTILGMTIMWTRERRRIGRILGALQLNGSIEQGGRDNE